jgi:hypothetical protein
VVGRAPLEPRVEAASRRVLRRRGLRPNSHTSRIAPSQPADKVSSPGGRAGRLDSAAPGCWLGQPLNTRGRRIVESWEPMIARRVQPSALTSPTPGARQCAVRRRVDDGTGRFADLRSLGRVDFCGTLKSSVEAAGANGRGAAIRRHLAGLQVRHVQGRTCDGPATYGLVLRRQAPGGR